MDIPWAPRTNSTCPTRTHYFCLNLFLLDLPTPNQVKGIPESYLTLPSTLPVTNSDMSLQSVLHNVLALAQASAIIRASSMVSVTKESPHPGQALLWLKHGSLGSRVSLPSLKL